MAKEAVAVVVEVVFMVCVSFSFLKHCILSFFNLVGLFIIIFCWPVYCCWRLCAGKPRRSNMKFINQRRTDNAELQAIDLKFFQSDLWESQYLQHSLWHAPDQLQLSFDSVQSTVTGSGSDTVGVYSIVGIYSTQTRRIALTKTYQLGTGNPLENLGHDVIIQLEWNRASLQFEGRWYVRTTKYRGSGEFRLKYSQPSSFASIYEKV